MLAIAGAQRHTTNALKHRLRRRAARQARRRGRGERAGWGGRPHALGLAGDDLVEREEPQAREGEEGRGAEEDKVHRDQPRHPGPDAERLRPRNARSGAVEFRLNSACAPRRCTVAGRVRACPISTG